MIVSLNPDTYTDAPILTRPQRYNHKMILQILKHYPFITGHYTEIASALMINTTTLHKYMTMYPRIMAAIADIRANVNGRVVRALLRRAEGTETTETKTETDSQGRIKQTLTRKEALPDVEAALAWLYNREPEQWARKKEDHEEGNITINVIGFTGSLPARDPAQIPGPDNSPQSQARDPLIKALQSSNDSG